MSPRYDVPKAAPEPLREVQQFVNSADTEHGAEWLPDWLAERGADGESLDRARELREALRSLLRANNGSPLDAKAVAIVDSAAARVTPGLDRKARPRLSAADPIDRVVAIALEAMLDGTWPRLKACPTCRWAFYDSSRNRSASWCSMRICGNRMKTRAYRARLRGSSRPE